MTESQRKELKYVHRMEDKRRYADRVKAVLLLDSGWTLEKISEALLLDPKTILRYRSLYEEGGVDRLCCDNLKGSFCRLTQVELEEVKLHLQEHLYSSTSEVVSYVEGKFGIRYSISGITELLHRLGFVYKKTKQVPGKADPEAQREFLNELDKLKESKKAGDKLYYLDGVHPQHNSLPAHGWILKGEDKTLKSNTGRKRLNINGALDAKTLEAIVRDDKTLNAESTIALLETLERKNPDAEAIYCIVDNARYYKNHEVTAFLKNSRIKLIFLPPYSPNLNLIERLWKFFKKMVLANRYYESFLEFKNAALSFFQPENLKQHFAKLQSLLTPKFHIFSS